MKETILLAPGVNGSELLRTMAKHGTDTLGLRVCGAVELAKRALAQSGAAVTRQFFPKREEPTMIASFLREIPYFANASYADAEAIAAALDTMRMLIPENEEACVRETLPKGEFSEKNKALLAAYERYLRALGESGRIDSVGLMRMALGKAAPIDAAILTLREYPLAPLERRLA